MAGLSWRHRGAMKRQTTRARLDAQAVKLAIEERHVDDDDWWGPDYTCGDDCSMCVPDWPERAEKLRQIQRANRVPMFTFAERLLAQVGIDLRLVHAVG